MCVNKYDPFDCRVCRETRGLDKYLLCEYSKQQAYSSRARGGSGHEGKFTRRRRARVYTGKSFSAMHSDDDDSRISDGVTRARAHALFFSRARAGRVPDNFPARGFS